MTYSNAKRRADCKYDSRPLLSSDRPPFLVILFRCLWTKQPFHSPKNVFGIFQIILGFGSCLYARRRISDLAQCHTVMS